MRRFHVFALVAVVSLAGTLGLAFGQSGHPQPGAKSQATKPRPPAPPGKRPPSKALPQAKKSPTHGGQQPVGPRGKGPHLTGKGQAKGGKGSKGGAGRYSSDDYKRDLNKAGEEVLDGFKEEFVPDLAIAGGFVAGSPGGPLGAAAGAAGMAIPNAPQLIDAKDRELKGAWDAATATERYAGSWLNGFFNSNRPPAQSKNGAQKSNPRPAKSR
jgi:hypothetical protein